MGWFIQTATFVIFNKVCTSQVCAMFFISSLRRLKVMFSVAVFSLVHVISTPHYSLPVMVMAFSLQISSVLDGDTSIVAQPGVQGRIFGRTHFLSSVDLQCHLRPWTQLGTRGHCK